MPVPRVSEKFYSFTSSKAETVAYLVSYPMKGSATDF
jgi:hypothetical protein